MQTIIIIIVIIPLLGYCNIVNTVVNQDSGAKSITWDYNTKTNKYVHYVKNSSTDKLTNFKDGKYIKLSEIELINK